MQWDRVRELMEKNGLTSKDIAAIAGVVPSAITKWKAGSSIRSTALRRLAVYFGVSSDWLMSASSDPPSKHAPIITPEEKTLHSEMSDNTEPYMVECLECKKKAIQIERLERIIDKLTK